MKISTDPFFSGPAQVHVRMQETVRLDEQYIQMIQIKNYLLGISLQRFVSVHVSF